MWVLDKIRDVVGATNLMPQRLIITILMEGTKIVSGTEITTLDDYPRCDRGPLLVSPLHHKGIAFHSFLARDVQCCKERHDINS